MWEYEFSLTHILPCSCIFDVVYKQDFYRSNDTQISLKIAAIKTWNCGSKFCKKLLFMKKGIISSITKCRSRHSQMFFKIGVLKNFAIFIGKHLCWSLFLIKLRKLQHLRTSTSVNKLTLRIKDSQCSFQVNIVSKVVCLWSSSSLDT